MREFKNRIITSLKDFFDQEYQRKDLDSMIKTPPNEKIGDFSFPCYDIGRKWGFDKKETSKAAELIKTGLELDPNISTEVKEGFLNFKINNNTLTDYVLDSVNKQGDNFGRNNIGKGKKVVIDYSAPNIGKPLHVGHIRSTILGDSIIKLLKFNGYHTWGINYLGDIGLHIGKTLYALNEWGNKEKIIQNPEEEILNLYVGFCKRELKNKKLSNKAKTIVQKIEAKDKKILDDLKFINEMSMISFNRVYNLLDIEFDETTGQSNFSKPGKEFVQRALDIGIAYKDETGAVTVNLSKHKLPNKVILRSDGTAIYSTQDLGAAHERYKEHKFDSLLYVVATEQDAYFKQIFKTLEIAGNSWAKNCKHINFGMINLKEGKMSSREGKIIYLEEVLNKAIGKAKDIIEEKSPYLENKNEVAKKIGIGAIKYMILSIDYSKNIEFSWNKALNLSGNSATYIQYSHARANSIINKSKIKNDKYNVNNINTNAELNLIRKIGQFPLVVESSCANYKPHIIAKYANELSNLFNHFYNSTPVIGEANEQSRIQIVKAYKTTVNNAMKLLGIQLPNKM